MRLGPGDEERAARVLLHPSVRSQFFDDGLKMSTQAIGAVLRDEEVFVLMPIEGAVLLVTPFLYSSFMIHQAAIPEVRGAAFAKASLEAVRWIFRNIAGCRKLVGFTPSGNLPAIASAKRAGFVVEGCITGAVLKDEKPHDLVVLGLSKEEVLRWEG